MFRRTKIVATIGPASASEAMLDRLITAGVNVFRLNFSHGSAADHRQVAACIRAAADRQQRTVAILADLQGPKIRIGRFRDGPVLLRHGQSFVLDAGMDEMAGEPDRVGITYKELVSDCRVGDTLLLDDGLIEMQVDDVRDNALHCTVTVGGKLSNNKGVNRKGGGLTAPALTERIWPTSSRPLIWALIIWRCHSRAIRPMWIWLASVIVPPAAGRHYRQDRACRGGQ